MANIILRQKTQLYPKGATLSFNASNGYDITVNNISPIFTYSQPLDTIDGVFTIDGTFLFEAVIRCKSENGTANPFSLLYAATYGDDPFLIGQYLIGGYVIPGDLTNSLVFGNNTFVENRITFSVLTYDSNQFYFGFGGTSNLPDNTDDNITMIFDSVKLLL